MWPGVVFYIKKITIAFKKLIIGQMFQLLYSVPVFNLYALHFQATDEDYCIHSCFLKASGIILEDTNYYEDIRNIYTHNMVEIK